MRLTRNERRGEERYCEKCHILIAPREPYVHKPYGNYHQACYWKLCQPKRLRGYAAMSLLLALPAFGAHQVPPKMVCETQDVTHAVCEVKSYFGAHLPRWEVYRDGELVADATAMKFSPVIGEEWRVVRAIIPLGRETSIFEVRVRLNGKTKRANFQGSKRAERIAWNSP